MHCALINGRNFMRNFLIAYQWITRIGVISVHKLKLKPVKFKFAHTHKTLFHEI